MIGQSNQTPSANGWSKDAHMTHFWPMWYEEGGRVGASEKALSFLIKETADGREPLNFCHPTPSNSCFGRDEVMAGAAAIILKSRGQVQKDQEVPA